MGKKVVILANGKPTVLTKGQKKSDAAGLIPSTKAPGKVARALWH